MTLATRYVNGNNSGPYLNQPKIVVMHSTRSGQTWTDAQELEATVNWFTNPAGSSAHWILSETERVRTVKDDLIAWHSAYLNTRSWGIELTQPTVNRPFRDGHYDNAALIGRHYITLGVAPVWLSYWDGGQASGFVAHEDTKQGRESGKTDPGSLFDRARFIASLEDDMTQDEFNKMYQIAAETVRVRAQDVQGNRTSLQNQERWNGILQEHRADGGKHSAGEAHDHGIPAGRTGEA